MNKVLNGAKRKPQPRITKLEGASETFTRSAVTNIPKRLEALFILFADTKDNQLLLTREELDINPGTRDLPSEEKNLLVEYWPQFRKNQQEARDIRKERAEQAKSVIAVHTEAKLVIKEAGITKDMPVAEQSRLMSQVMGRGYIDAVAAFYKTEPLTPESTDYEVAQYKLRRQRAKDFKEFALGAVDLHKKLKEIEDAGVEATDLTDELDAQLKAADAVLHRHSSGVVIDEEDDGDA